MIRDRGTKKWTAMMLPEHISELRKWMDEDELSERPELSEWDLQAIQDELEIALKRKCETLVKTWKDGRIEMYQGIIEGIELKLECVLLQDPFELERISIIDIISVQSVN